MADRSESRFRATLFRYPGPGGWTFAVVPEEHAPPVTAGWGRTPVSASVDGRAWETSVWRDKGRRTLLAVPKRIRGEKAHGDVVDVVLGPPGPRRRSTRLVGPAAALGGRARR